MNLVSVIILKISCVANFKDGNFSDISKTKAKLWEKYFTWDVILLADRKVEYWSLMIQCIDFKTLKHHPFVKTNILPYDIHNYSSSYYIKLHILKYFLISMNDL